MNIFLCTPMYNNTCLSDGWKNSVFTATLPGGPVDQLLVPQTSQSSLLPLSFNKLWMQAVLGKFDYFAMLHSDVCAEPGWLDELVIVADDFSADMVSSGCRIKDASLDFSVALDLDQDPESLFNIKRLNAEHLLQMPAVYTRHGAGKALGVKDYGALLLNTGCFIVDLRRDWVRCTPFQLHAWNDWENATAYCESEDWHLSRLLYQKGLRVYGTKRVRTQHLGVLAYDSHYLELMSEEERKAQSKQ